MLVLCIGPLQLLGIIRLQRQEHAEDAAWRPSEVDVQLLMRHHATANLVSMQACIFHHGLAVPRSRVTVHLCCYHRRFNAGAQPAIRWPEGGGWSGSRGDFILCH